MSGWCALSDAIKDDPAGALSGIAQASALSTDKWTYRIVVLSLGFAVLIGKSVSIKGCGPRLCELGGMRLDFSLTIAAHRIRLAQVRTLRLTPLNGVPTVIDQQEPPIEKTWKNGFVTTFTYKIK